MKVPTRKELLDLLKSMVDENVDGATRDKVAEGIREVIDTWDEEPLDYVVIMLGSTAREMAIYSDEEAAYAAARAAIGESGLVTHDEAGGVTEVKVNGLAAFRYHREYLAG